MTELIQGLVAVLLPLVEKYERGERITVMEYVTAAAALYKLISDYVSTRPVVGQAESLGEAFAAPMELAVEAFGGEDQLADVTDRLSVAVTGQRVEWKPDGHLLKQILPVLIKLLPLLI